LDIENFSGVSEATLKVVVAGQPSAGYTLAILRELAFRAEAVGILG